MMNFVFKPQDRFEGDKESFLQFQAKIKKVSKEESIRLGEELEKILNKPPYENQTADIEKLVLGGANLDIRLGKNGDHPLLFCVKKNNQDWFRIFARAGIPVDKPNDYGTTALMRAARHDRLNIFDDCIFLGADVNLQCSDGDTAAHSASRHNSLGALKKLYALGADFSKVNNEDKSAIDVAGSDTTKQFFKNLGKNSPQKNGPTTESDVQNEIASAQSKFNEMIK